MKQLIFLCQTPYHLLVSAFYCKKIKNKKIRKILIFDNTSSHQINPERVCPFYDLYINIPGDWRDRNIVWRQWFKLRYEGYFWRWSGMKKIYRDDVDKNILVCFNDCNKIYDRVADMISDAKHEIVMIEEGVGSYVTIQNISRKEGILSVIWNRYCLGVRPYSPRYFGMDNRIDTFIMKKPEKFPKEKLRGRKLVQQKEIDYTIFDSVIESTLSDNLTMLLKTKKWLLYIGDSFEDERNIPENVEMIYLKEIFDFLVSQGYLVLIKPHPREPENKYKNFCGERVVDLSRLSLAWIPMECLADKLRPEVVLSPCSSCVSDFIEKEYCRAAVYLYRLFPPAETVEDDYYQQLAREHSKVSAVNDYEELGKLLEDRS